MDHDAVLEALELATAEPDGLDRLMAGDTPAAQAVAGHLAGCPECTLELVRLRRLGAVVRESIATTPSPDLRDRTLAYVRQHGRPRGPAVAPDQVPAAVPIAVVAGSGAGDRATGAGRGRPLVTWIASLAAAVVLQVTAEPDVTRVGLANPSGAAISGTLLFSPSTTDLVVVADGLTQPASGMEYRCWVAIDGKRQGIGRMFFGGGLAYWVGPSPAVAGLGGDVTFGVSLVSAEGGIVAPDPVLTGGS
jgi:hypothetical protein